MRILVIDDYLNVEMALRGILDGHTVAGVRDPAALPRMLAYEEPFEAAIVDLRYVQSAATGLTALATLRQLSPGTKTIISTTDEEENRLLYLLAAFQFFEPRALLAKRADAFVTRAVVEAIGRGDPSPSPGRGPVPPGRRDAAAAARPARAQPDRTGHLAGACPLRQAPPDRERRARAPADAGRLHRGEGRRHRRRGRSLPPAGRGTEPVTDADTAGPGAAHGANLIRVIHFARTHEQFFADAGGGRAARGVVAVALNRM